MYKIGDYVVYKREVCKISDIVNNYFSSGKQYYIMHPIDDESLSINVPTDNKLGLLRNVISKEEAEELINKIYHISPIEVNDKMIDNEYRNLMNSMQLEDLIKIIKTTYLRNDERIKNGKKAGDKDNNYFKKAEKILYNELSVSLNMSYEEVKEYVFDRVENTCD